MADLSDGLFPRALDLATPALDGGIVSDCEQQDL
jgi:hypothetical protein